ncbi:MAG: hypothetical protein P8K27_05545 [Gammaproteobacteria bacterium]|nr:hypothetical protein [Gammaproteobacteria bacterium]
MLLVFFFSVALISCEIEPISVGTWEVQIQAENASYSFTWILTSEPELRVTGSGNFVAEEVELSGSRINWSAERYDFLLPGISDRVNFNGTVSGDQLAGTLFSQQGNYTVTGKRLVDSGN